METKLIEKRTTDGAYGFQTEAMILDTDQGRLLITDGYGGDDINGYCYRWQHGLAVRLKADDTFDSLSEPWNDTTDTWVAVINGYDPERPILGYSGYAIEAIAKKHS